MSYFTASVEEELGWVAIQRRNHTSHMVLFLETYVHYLMMERKDNFGNASQEQPMGALPGPTYMGWTKNELNNQAFSPNGTSSSQSSDRVGIHDCRHYKKMIFMPKILTRRHSVALSTVESGFRYPFHLRTCKYQYWICKFATMHLGTPCAHW